MRSRSYARARAALAAVGAGLVLTLAACGGGGDSDGDGDVGAGPAGCEPPTVTDADHPDLEEGLASLLEVENTTPCEPLPPGYRMEEVVTGLDFPIAMAFTPDGRILITERVTGNIRVVEDGELLEEPFAQVESLFTRNVAGLIGIAVDPDYENNPYVYVYYTEDTGTASNTVIARYLEQDGRGVNPERILEGIPGDPTGSHTGGNMEFGPDGKLYVSVGDTCHRERGTCGNRAQDLTHPAGKLLRLNPDGSAPEDNPFVDEPDADPRIFARGLRNTFDFTFYPTNETIIAADNGPATDDEINLIEAGGNYGWPVALGAANDPRFIDPIYVFPGLVVPVGMDAYRGDRLEQFQDDIFLCTFSRGGLLHRLRMTEPHYEEVREDLAIGGGCTSGVQSGPDGNLYFMEFVSGTIYRITNEPDAGDAAAE